MPATTDPARKRPALITVDEAAELCGLPRKQLVELLDRRAALIANAGWLGRLTANPRTVASPGKDPTWNRNTFLMWAVRMGLAPYEGRNLIGYAGIAVMFGWEEQSVRAHIERERAAFPARVTPPAEVVVFDRAEVAEYGEQRGICFADGRPNVLRPHRGHPVVRP